MSVCGDLVSFAEGELGEADAEAFREHLPDCEPCQVSLMGSMQLTVQLDSLPCPHPDHRRGTRGGLRRNQEVCMACGEVVLKK